MPDTTPLAPGDDMSLEQLNLHRGALNSAMGIELIEASPQRCVATMPVEGNTQPYGIMHGGASVVLAETLGSTGAALHAATLGKIAVGLEISASHHYAARSGTVTGTATALSLGGSVATYEVAITDEEHRRLCTARITCIVRDAPPGH